MVFKQSVDVNIKLENPNGRLFNLFQNQLFIPDISATSCTVDPLILGSSLYYGTANSSKME